MATRKQLKKGDISIRNLLTISYTWYKKNDSKAWRAKIDIKSGKIVGRMGLDYDRKTKSWNQTSREVKIEVLVKSQPESYDDKSELKNHFYPVTILIKDWNQKFDSAFRWRTGSNYKPRFAKKKITEQKTKAAKDKVRKENKKIMQSNIKKGVQLQFFFQLSFVLEKWGLLFGPQHARGAPKKTNPDLVPFADKHFFYIARKILPPLFSNPKLGQKWGKL